MNRIVSNSEILGGKPVIRGTRLSVDFILNMLASGVSEKEILDDYQHITIEDIHACLAFAANALRNDIYLELEKVK
ncbi:MAG: DUF433 domain-containing protein [Bacteroidales bacterium]|nr:DUF433 domain-containing protein [Bacteroidales bacterium]